jgi:hypothetical protein
MFKVDWEKTSTTYQLSEGMVEKMVRLAYPDEKLISSELIAGGCANLNYKIQLKDKTHPLILRVYHRCLTFLNDQNLKTIRIDALIFANL